MNSKEEAAALRAAAPAAQPEVRLGHLLRAMTEHGTPTASAIEAQFAPLLALCAMDGPAPAAEIIVTMMKLLDPPRVKSAIEHGLRLAEAAERFAREEPE